MGAAEEALSAVVGSRSVWATNARNLALAAIADTLAIGVAGMAEEQVSMARSTLLPSGHPDAVAGWRGPERYPIVDAAFLNAVAAHSLDWDDYMHPMHGHCSSVLLPVAWTIGEQAGASGKDVVDAFLVGYQVDYLASLAFGNGHYRRGWHATSTVGTLGAAAVAARMLGLTTEQAGHALAIAASFASGLRVNFGTPTKSLHAGAAARHGVQAAQLALAGATGSADWLLGTHGMLAVFGGELGAPQAEGVIVEAAATGTHGIETGWGLVQKPYCCCGSCHAAVEAVVGLAEEYELVADDIRLLTVHVDPLIPAIMQVDLPWDAYGARYSPTWVIAAAAIDRAAGPAQFSRGALARDDIHRLRERVVVVTDLVTTDHDRFAGRVEIEYRGRVLSREIRHAAGHPERPMSVGERVAKQRAALVGVMSEADAETVIAAAAELDSLPRLSTLGDRIRQSLRS